MKNDNMPILLTHVAHEATGATPIANLPTATTAAVTEDTVADDSDDEETGGDTVVGNKDGFEFVKQEFKGSKKTGKSNPLEGYGFASIKITDPFILVSHFDNLCRSQNKTVQDERKVVKVVDGKPSEVTETYTRLLTGKEILVDLLQTAYIAKLRIKVKSIVPKIGTPECKTETDLLNWLEKKTEGDTNKLLFSVDEASAWIPGIREMSNAKKFELKMHNVKELIEKYGKDDARVIAVLVEIATELANR